MTHRVRQAGLAAALAIGVFVAIAPRAEANAIDGVMDIVSGVLNVPLATLQGTFSGPPVIGTLFGAINGVLGGVALVGRGALELGAAGLQVAKMVGPYLIPIFL